jgi:hypothetical protein
MTKNYLTIFSCLAALLTLNGCATRYHSIGFNGGYSEINTSQDSFVVTFKGNRYTSSEKVLQYALTRASELTVARGFKYFSVISSVDQTQGYDYSHTTSNMNGSMNCYDSSYFNHSHLSGSTFSSTEKGSISKPGLRLSVKCYRDEPDIDFIDAEYFLQNNIR